MCARVQYRFRVAHDSLARGQTLTKAVWATRHTLRHVHTVETAQAHVTCQLSLMLFKRNRLSISSKERCSHKSSRQDRMLQQHPHRQSVLSLEVDIIKKQAHNTWVKLKKVSVLWHTQKFATLWAKLLIICNLLLVPNKIGLIFTVG